MIRAKSKELKEDLLYWDAIRERFPTFGRENVKTDTTPFECTMTGIELSNAIESIGDLPELLDSPTIARSEKTNLIKIRFDILNALLRGANECGVGNISLETIGRPYVKGETLSAFKSGNIKKAKDYCLKVYDMYKQIIPDYVVNMTRE